MGHGVSAVIKAVKKAMKLLCMRQEKDYVWHLKQSV